MSKFNILGLQSYHEKGTKQHHPGILVRPVCSLKAGCIEFGTARYKCCGNEPGDEGCTRLHSCCGVRNW